MNRTISIRTEEGRKVNESALHCMFLTLDDLYKSSSYEKEELYQKCKTCCIDDNGKFFRVGNANTISFMATWIFELEGKIYRRVVTKSNSYLITFD